MFGMVAFRALSRLAPTFVTEMVYAAGLVVYKQVQKDVFHYLLLKANYPPYHWTPPKGHVDPGETEMMTALRETNEEAGLTQEDLDVLDFKKDVFYEVKGKMKKVAYWLAMLKTDKEVTLSHEHTDLIWTDCEKAIELIGFPATAEVIKDCEEFLRTSNKEQE